MNIYLCGQKQFGAAALALIQKMGHRVMGVSAPLHASDGKAPDRLRAAAEAGGLPYLPSGRLNAETLPGNVDLILAAHSHDFIGKKTRLKARLGGIGYHPSLLPLYRGRDAVRWQIKLRERVSGGTVYWLSDNMDAGDVAAQRHVFVGPKDTAESLWREKLYPLGLQLIAQVLGDLSRGVIVAIPQDNAAATWFPSMDRPPAFKPDLPQLGAPPAGFTVARDWAVLLEEPDYFYASG